METITRTIYLLTADFKTRKFITVNREMVEETPKVLNIGAKLLARRSNVMWDILVGTAEAAKTLAGSTPTTKSLRLQTKYMDSRRSRITLYRVSMYITEDHQGSFSQIMALWFRQSSCVRTETRHHSLN